MPALIEVAIAAYEPDVFSLDRETVKTNGRNAPQSMLALVRQDPTIPRGFPASPGAQPPDQPLSIWVCRPGKLWIKMTSC